MKYKFNSENTKVKIYVPQGDYCVSCSELQGKIKRRTEVQICLTDINGIRISQVKTVQLSHNPDNPQNKNKVFCVVDGKKVAVNSQCFFADIGFAAYLGKKGFAKNITEACTVTYLPGPINDCKTELIRHIQNSNLDNQALESIMRVLRYEQDRCRLQGGN